MDLLHAIALGIVEGLTEFVPVSSTGHLILTGHWLGLDADPSRKAAVDAFDIVIQAGAWLACLVYYAPLLRQRAVELVADDDLLRQRARSLLVGLAVAFVPVVIAGLLFRKVIKAHLFGPAPVAVALVVGGVVMMALDRRKARESGRSLDQIGVWAALGIGIAQCAALVPGTSRSMATIAGAMLLGFHVRAAADFSFLLAIPVLGAATAYELLKEWPVLIEQIGPAAMAVGMATAFAAGWASIAGFLRVISRHGLMPFGAYRVVLGGMVWLALMQAV